MGEFEEVYRKHLEAVFRYSVRCIGRRDIAEEITSEAFLALYRNRDRIDASQLPAWLFTVVRNRAVDYWRRCALEQRYVEDCDRRVASPRSRIEDGLFESSALKPIHRVCLILRYIYGMDRTEIARQTGLSETQVKGHLQYGRQLLRKELEASK